MCSNDHEETLIQKIKELESERDDFEQLYNNIIEHSTELENELEEKNQSISQLLNDMKKYLSPQLYDSIVGGTLKSDLSYKRTKLTIFFSDLVGFTELTDQLEPEVMSDCLNSYLTEMSKVALKYGGTIDKFIGDAVMVFLGAPEFTNDHDHAIRCVKMALEMKERLELLNLSWMEKGLSGQFKVRMGINTGFCTVGNFGSNDRMDYTIIGSQVNIAARLETFAQPDSIVISESTYLLVKDVIEVEPLGEINVKGVHYSIKAFEVKGLLKESKKSTSANKYFKKENDGFILKIVYSKDDKESDVGAILAAIKSASKELEKLVDDTKP